MTGYVADLSWKSGARAIEKIDRLRSTLAVNVLSNHNTYYVYNKLTMNYTGRNMSYWENISSYNCYLYINNNEKKT